MVSFSLESIRLLLVMQIYQLGALLKQALVGVEERRPLKQGDGTGSIPSLAAETLSPSIPLTHVQYIWTACTEPTCLLVLLRRPKKDDKAITCNDVDSMT